MKSKLTTFTILTWFLYSGIAATFVSCPLAFLVDTAEKMQHGNFGTSPHLTVRTGWWSFIIVFSIALFINQRRHMKHADEDY